jgi:importin-9
MHINVSHTLEYSCSLVYTSFCKNCSDSEVFPRAPRICKSIEGFIPITSSDTLTLVLDALSTLLLVHRGTWLTIELVETLVPAVLNVWSKGVQGTYYS